VSVNGQPLSAGDALLSDGGDLAIERGNAAEVLVFDLPGNWPPR